MARQPDPDGAARRYFELPFAVPGQRLVRPDLGLVSMVSRGPEHSYELDVTILDAADLRLTRAGITLAHRVADGHGEWYLAAPAWAPLLPEETVEPMLDSDLPPQIAELVLPFRRQAALQPVAALHCERAAFSIRGPERRTRAVVHDDRVTVRRGGVTVSRYREVTLQPVDLNRKQLGWLTETLQAVGGTRVERLPSPGSRLGVPASGLDRWSRTGWDTGTDLEGFVTALVASRLREWLVADLSLRTGSTDSAGDLTEVLSGLRGELRGLGAALDPTWLDEVDEELDWLVAELGGAVPAAGAGREQLTAVLAGQRYLHLLDLVVQASLVPRLGRGAESPASEALGRSVRAAAEELIKAGRRLGPSSPPVDWVAMGALVEQAHAATLVARRNLPGWARKVDKRLRRVSDLLPGCVDPQLETIEHSVEDLGPQQAFAAGRRYEQLLTAQSRARRELLARWPQLENKLRTAIRASW
ncbi:hypothetical protein [Auraticoccus cholistanensis]|uniref:hypothetical protein n=1 Tax=Auraticoccus cholistanensis TaxID=2656650 RepID=UPI0018D247D7|nr:hypothetical protein [Auraticoccus cholistanensis]